MGVTLSMLVASAMCKAGSIDKCAVDTCAHIPALVTTQFADHDQRLLRAVMSPREVDW